MARKENSKRKSGDALVRAYGLNWNREAVNWKVKKLPGARRKYKVTVRNTVARNKRCDAWAQRGIYALYKDFALVYVGLATSSVGGIGSRLKSHQASPRMQDRWDSFSWFGIDSYDRDGEIEPFRERPISEAALARTLELVAILIADPLMNRSQGKFKGAERIYQDTSNAPEPVQGVMAKMLAEIKAINTQLTRIKERRINDFA